MNHGLYVGVYEPYLLPDEIFDGGCGGGGHSGSSKGEYAAGEEAGEGGAGEH